MRYICGKAEKTECAEDRECGAGDADWWQHWDCLTILRHTAAMELSCVLVVVLAGRPDSENIGRIITAHF